MQTLLRDNSVTAEAIKCGFISVVGSGNRVQFWTELQLEGRPLKVAFPRCFALATRKSGAVQSFGYWQGSTWTWNIEVRRPCFDWEKDQWGCFMSFLECISVRKQVEDRLLWSFNVNGNFSVNSFTKQIQDRAGDKEGVPYLLWKGICPPKVEVFLWQLWRGRILVKEELGRRGMQQALNDNCVLCSKEIESLDHLFLHCNWTSELWKISMAWWEVQSCTNHSIGSWLEAWYGLCPGYNQERAWCVMFCAIVWTVWECRNQKTFDNKVVDSKQAADLVKFRTVWWFKHCGKGSMEAVEALLLNMKDLCLDKKRVKRSKVVDWIPPEHGKLKFNVDGSVLGKPGPAGIGGVLRDSYGKVLCLFLFHLGILDSNMAELLAIHRAARLVAENPTLRGRDIDIVSDSKVAVAWVNNSDFGNVSCINDLFDIREVLMNEKNLRVVFDSRMFNSFADSLAKMGANNVGNFIEWSDV